jgi:hypothetical protein
MKVLINRCYGGFGVSNEALKLFNERSEKKVQYQFELRNQFRDDPILINIVEELGDRANGSCSKLVVASFPDEYDYWIEDYDGIETIHLTIRESHLRNLIRLGNEDDIVNYVKNAI